MMARNFGKADGFVSRRTRRSLIRSGKFRASPLKLLNSPPIRLASPFVVKADGTLFWAVFPGRGNPGATCRIWLKPGRLAVFTDREIAMSYASVLL